jgi:nucleobase:cation symporter-1, NCS1 family
MVDGPKARGATATYGSKVLKVEPFGIERISTDERHGRPWKLFPFWFGANVTLYSFLVGFLGITVFALPVGLAIAGIVLGTVLGAAPFALLSLIGPATGYPQIAHSRSAFGRRGAYVPAALNWFSTTGWSAVTFILGGLALSEFLPAIPFAAGVAIFAAIQIVVALYGHNLLHRFEQVMALLLVVVFAAMTVVSIQGLSKAAYTPTGGGLDGFAFMVILAASIPLSWAPYAADFSRYLPEETRRRSIFLPSFLGMAAACVWVEAIGVLLSAQLGALGDPVAVFAHAFGTTAVGPLLLLLAVNLLAANAPNLYSSGLSLLALDVPVKRRSSVLVGGAIATFFAILGGAGGSSVYEGWLFFVEYWIAPWAAIVLMSYFIFTPRGTEARPDRARAWRSTALVAYGAAVLVAVPFMDQPAFLGPASAALGGLDLSDLVSFLVAALVFYALASREVRTPHASDPTGLRSDSTKVDP